MHRMPASETKGKLRLWYRGTRAIHDLTSYHSATVNGLVAIAAREMCLIYAVSDQNMPSLVTIVRESLLGKSFVPVSRCSQLMAGARSKGCEGGNDGTLKASQALMQTAVANDGDGLVAWGYMRDHRYFQDEIFRAQVRE